jgi:hypothetical protein
VRRWRKGWRRLVLLTCLVLLAAGVFVLWPRTDPTARITKENFEAITAGMDRAAVEALLGPPGDHATGETGFYWSAIGDQHTFAKEEAELFVATQDCWGCDTNSIFVRYGSAGTVVQSSYWTFDPPKQRGLDNLLWRAKRQWRKWFPE